MPVSNGCATGTAVEGIRVITLLHAIKIYVETDGKMQMTRMATPGFMRDTATEYTGKKYPRSLRGLIQAYNDLVKLTEERTSLDELGQVGVVNRLVGSATAPEPN